MLMSELLPNHMIFRKSQYQLILTGISGLDRFRSQSILIINWILRSLLILKKMKKYGVHGAGIKRWVADSLPTGEHICLILYSGGLEWTVMVRLKHHRSAMEPNLSLIHISEPT